MANELDGPRLEPTSGQAKRLVVFLHGYGADGNDLIDIGRAWQGMLPDTAFVSPHAPEPCGQAPTGKQWFPLFSRAQNERWDGVNKAGPLLQAFLDAELTRRKLSPSALALVGFSQGTMMSLQVGLRRAISPAAIIGYSGALAGPEKLQSEIRVKPPILMIHGDEDEMLPVSRMHTAVAALVKAGLTVQSHVSPGVGHGIGPDGLQLGGKFIHDALYRPA